MVALELRSRPYDILISDDDPACRETIEDALSTKGYRTHVTSCGREAIEYVRAHFVHVVIVDMGMPDLTGLETVSIIRREMSVSIPSILVSADSSPELKLRALSAHFESFMAKPLNLGALRHVVEDIIRRHYETDL